jgi:hypothetical protein
MNLYIISASLIIALVVTLLFAFYTRRPVGRLFWFFAIIFLATWTGQLWITPLGPVTKGIKWIPLVVVSLFFSLFMLALISPAAAPPNTENEEQSPFIILGIFFWLMLIVLVASIILGYSHMSNLIVE